MTLEEGYRKCLLFGALQFRPSGTPRKKVMNQLARAMAHRTPLNAELFCKLRMVRVCTCRDDLKIREAHHCSLFPNSMMQPESVLRNVQIFRPPLF